MAHRNCAIGAEGIFVILLVMERNGFWKTKIRGEIKGLDFNRHNKYHLARAAQEGIVFSLFYGAEIMQEMGCH